MHAACKCCLFISYLYFKFVFHIYNKYMEYKLQVSFKLQTVCLTSLHGVMYFVDWTCGLDSQTELEIALNTDPGSIHFFQHWKHYNGTTAAGTILPNKL